MQLFSLYFSSSILDKHFFIKLIEECLFNLLDNQKKLKIISKMVIKKVVVNPVKIIKHQQLHSH
jgi:hypothetical protein